MQVDYIIKEVSTLVAKTNTRNPEDICRFLGYQLRYVDLQRKLKGYFIVINRITNIVLDENIVDAYQPILIAHELGHARLHKQTTAMTGFQEMEFLEKRETDPLEYEANLFAAELLLEDQEVLKFLNQYTFFETAKILEVPAALLDFKLILLKAKGYQLQPLEISQADFLKDRIEAYQDNSIQ